jgi:hypothetical protein
MSVQAAIERSAAVTRDFSHKDGGDSGHWNGDRESQQDVREWR